MNKNVSIYGEGIIKIQSKREKKFVFYCNVRYNVHKWRFV